MKFFRSLILFYIILISGTCLSQVMTPNDGFEGTPTKNIPPAPWYNCNDSISTVDTQPGFFHNSLPATQGNSYISIVTRADETPGTAEMVWSDLLVPFEKEKCYNFKLDITMSNDFRGTLGFTDYYFNFPCILRVFGFNGDCRYPNDKELLWTSEVIHNFSWQTFTIPVKPLNRTYHRIALSPYFTPPDNFRNSALLIDNLQYIPAEHAFIYHDGFLSLSPDAMNVQWYFNDTLVAGANSSKMPVLESGKYGASYYDGNGCLVSISEYITLVLQDFKCYPVPTTGLLTFEFYSSAKCTYRMTLIDEVGRFVIRRDLAVSEKENKIPVEIGFLATGPYHLKIERPGLDPVYRKIILLLQ